MIEPVTKVECPANQIFYGENECLPCLQTCGSQMAWCTRFVTIMIAWWPKVSLSLFGVIAGAMLKNFTWNCGNIWCSNSGICQLTFYSKNLNGFGCIWLIVIPTVSRTIILKSHDHSLSYWPKQRRRRDLCRFTRIEFQTQTPLIQNPNCNIVYINERHLFETLWNMRNINDF